MDRVIFGVGTQRFGLAHWVGVAGVVVVMGLAGAGLVRGQDEKKDGDFSAGINVSKQATAKDVGLPIYPGATPHKDAKDENSSANLGLWGGALGLKLAVLKLDSGDAAEKVAKFYRKALEKYGTVLDCSNANKSGDSARSDEKSTKLTCGDDKPDAGELLFKAGTKEKQHIVSVRPAGAGVNIGLVYLEARGTEQEAK